MNRNEFDSLCALTLATAGAGASAGSVVVHVSIPGPSLGSPDQYFGPPVIVTHVGIAMHGHACLYVRGSGPFAHFISAGVPNATHNPSVSD